MTHAAPNLLAFDTSTEQLSIAVGRADGGSPRVWTHDGPGGAMASATPRSSEPMPG